MNVVGVLWCLNWKRKLIDCTFFPLKSFLSLWTQIVGAAAGTASWEIDGRRTLAWRLLVPPSLSLGLQVYFRNVHPFGIVLLPRLFRILSKETTWSDWCCDQFPPELGIDCGWREEWHQELKQGSRHTCWEALAIICLGNGGRSGKWSYSEYILKYKPMLVRTGLWRKRKETRMALNLLARATGRMLS